MRTFALADAPKRDLFQAMMTGKYLLTLPVEGPVAKDSDHGYKICPFSAASMTGFLGGTVRCLDRPVGGETIFQIRSMMSILMAALQS